MGTSYAVELAAPIDDAVRTGLAELIEVELAAINLAMSTYDPRSELSEFNRRQDLRWAPASRGLLEVLDSASRISTSTQGAFDVTVGPLVDLWDSVRSTVPDEFRMTRSSSGFGTASAISTCKPTHPRVRSERDTVAPKST
jgi:thiamine biosynthesis lipoprotein